MTINDKRYEVLIPRGRCATFVVSMIVLIFAASANAQLNFTKAQVADRIRKVEDGVDEFRKYLENRGDNARQNAQTAQSSGAARRGRTNSTNAGSRQQRARQTKDELDDALDDLNGSTNRLRRKFDPTSNYMETRVQMERVMDDARRVNQVMARGSYGSQPSASLDSPARKHQRPCTLLRLNSISCLRRVNRIQLLRKISRTR